MSRTARDSVSTCWIGGDRIFGFPILLIPQVCTSSQESEEWRGRQSRGRRRNKHPPLSRQLCQRLETYVACVAQKGVAGDPRPKHLHHNRLEPSVADVHEL